MQPKKSEAIGGIVHVYQKFNPSEFPSPTQEPPDLVSGAFEHALAYGKFRELSEEELARAVRIDPSQIAGLGPSIDMLRQMLEERKRKILETYTTEGLDKKAQQRYEKASKRANPPGRWKNEFHKAVQSKQIYLLEQLWYRTDRETPEFASAVLHTMEALGDLYGIDELLDKYTFAGRERVDIPEALELKKILEQIDELLKQLEEAAKTAQIGLIDMEALSEFIPEGNLNDLNELREQINNLVKEAAERQGLERDEQGHYQLTPKAYKAFQSRLLQRIFSHLQAGDRVAMKGASLAMEVSSCLPRKDTNLVIRSAIWIQPNRSSMLCSNDRRSIQFDCDPRIWKFIGPKTHRDARPSS